MNKITKILTVAVAAIILSIIHQVSTPAFATTSQVTDVLEVNILPVDADIEISSTSGNPVTNPIYNLDILYNGVKNLKLNVINRDDNGDIIYDEEIWSAAGDFEPGAKNFILDLDNYGGYGNFTFIVTATDYYGEPVEKQLSMVYEEPTPEKIDGGYIEADPDTGDADIEIPMGIDIETVTTVRGEIYDGRGVLVRTVVTDLQTGEIKIYDRDGRLITTIPGGYISGLPLKIPFGGLDYGDYIVDISYLDGNGELVGDIYEYTVGYYGGTSIPVPDTGGSFHGLNISREDYIITGLIIFVFTGIAIFKIKAKK